MAAAPILIIFGITGDLSKRKLLPALYHLMSEDILPAKTTIIGISRHELVIDELLGNVELCVLEKDNVCDPDGIQKLRNALQSFRLDPTKAEDFSSLKSLLARLDDGATREHLFYMSIPPTAYGPIIDQLGATGMNHKNSRLLLEKPFGYDLASAEVLANDIQQHFDESQIYRIDHYLAKETAQNLLAFRAYNPLFHSLWNGQHIERVHVRAVEQLSIEGRADFYESIGALRDLIQSHLLQLLALTLMDLPKELTSAQIHTAKQAFFDQLQPADPAQAVRGQYDTYRQEVHNPESNTETYAKVQLSHSSKIWQGVDIVLETGKSLDKKDSSVTIVFKSDHAHPSNNLRFDIQPNEGITLDLIVKAPGLDSSQLRHTELSFDYAQMFAEDQHIEAYERVLIDAINADQALFASAPEVLETWRVIQPLLEAWHDNDNGLVSYKAGAAPESIK